VNAIMNLWVLYNDGDFLTSVEPVSYLGGTLLHGVKWLVGWLFGFFS
jgi:hypothetical protein